MKREQKYPDTPWFRYYNANPKNRFTGDCVYRALATATGKSWEEVVIAGAVLAIKYGYSPASRENYSKLLEMCGFVKCKQPRKRDGTKFRAQEFCAVQQQYCNDKSLRGAASEDGIEISDRIVAHVGAHHLVAIIDGKVNDIWDSTDECIGVYWVKL